MEKICDKMPIEEELYEVFPVCLFECFDQKTPMHFILSLKQSYDKIEDIVKTLHHCGAKVAFNKEEANVYSAVIADHDEVIDFYGPTFTMNYIADCMDSGKLQDIGKYRQKATKHLKIEDDAVCMKVVYYRKFGWDSVIKEEEKRWIDDNYKVQLTNDGTVISSPIVRNKDRTEEQIKMDEEDWIKDKGEGRGHLEGKEQTEDIIEEIEDNYFNNKEETKNKANGTRTRRLPYTKEERCKILKYIVEHNVYGRLKGKEMWVIMEVRKVCTSRTWQSMKEHFLKKIILELDSYDFLTNDQKRKIQRVVC